MYFYRKIAEFIVTLSYLGKIKYAPGTIGSLAALPFCYGIMSLIFNNSVILPLHKLFDGFNDFEKLLFSLIIITLVIVILLFITGSYFTYIYLQNHPQSDPKEVIIDELVGQMLVYALIIISPTIYLPALTGYLSSNILNIIFLLILPIILFRIFDIVKPWPICWLDQNIKGAFGVMIDDIAAAIFATVSYYALVFLAVNLV